MQTKRLLWIIPLGLGLALTLALLMALSPSPEVAHAWPVTPLPGGTRPPGPAFVEPGGTGGWCLQNDPCGSIQYAIDQCDPVNGDTIYVAQGTYTGTGTAVITITKNITLYGGWDGALTGPVIRDPDTYITVLDGEYRGRVVYITGTVAPILEGLILRDGEASGLGGDPFGFDVGGAVYANNASPVITDCHILTSKAQFGGGLALYYGTPTLGNSAVLSNTAIRSGGGVFLYHSPATIVGNTVVTNTANGSDQWWDGGGGLYLDSSAAVIRGNVIQDNSAPQSQGGGMFLYLSGAVVHDNTFVINSALYGGAVHMLQSPADFDANVVLENHATAWPGGFFIRSSTPFTLTNNIVALNFGDGGGPGALIANSSQGALLHNTFTDNFPDIWMIGIEPGAALAFTNTIFGPPGGIYVQGGGAVTLDTTLWFSSIPTVAGPGTIISRTNLYGDPHFVGLFHIGPNSAAIDQGANAGVTTDIDGEARPNGTRCDIGADEFYCYGLIGVVITGPTIGITNTAYTFTATVSPPTATLPITYAWQATGLTPVTNTVYALSDTATFTWTTTATQTVSVEAINCGNSQVTTHTIAIPRPQWFIYLPLVLRNS